MSTGEALLSFMDLLDLDEEHIDKRLKSIMMRDTYTNKHLTNVIQLLQYKLLINKQENTECSNSEELLFVAQLMKQMTSDKVQSVCKITNIVLNLNASTLVSHAEHFLQQILSEIPTFDSPLWSAELSKSEEAIAHLKLCDSILDAVIKNHLKVNLPFLNAPLMNMMYSRNEALRMNFIANTAPKLFEGVEGSNVFDLIWEHVKLSLMLSDEFKQIVLKTLCSLSEYYLPVPDSKGNVLYESEIVFRQEFWEIILFGLMSTDPMERKLSMYLFKRAIDCLMVHKLQKSITLMSEKGILFSWDHKNAEYSNSRWNMFFILMDSLEEKQANIVLPSLSLCSTLYDVSDCWLNCAFNIGLKHDSAQVRIKCIEQRFLKKLSSQSEAVVLLEALNDINIYDDPNVWNGFKKSLLEFISDVKVFSYIFKAIPLVKWSPVPLYNLSDALGSFEGNLETLSSEIPSNEMTSLLIEILKIPCNIFFIRKAFIANIVHCFGDWCTYLDWRNLADISSMLQLELCGENMADIKYRCNFLIFEYFCQDLDINMACLHKLMIDTHTYIDFGLMHLDFTREHVPMFIKLTNDIMDKINGYVTRQYSNKRECLNEVIFIAKLFSKTVNDCYMTTVSMALSKRIKIILNYILALLGNDMELEIDQIDSLTNCLDSITYVDAKEILMHLYKVSLLMLADKTVNLNKAVLSIFIIKNITENPWISKYYKQELIALKQLLDLINNFDNKQSVGRAKNAFYEKSCELVYLHIKDEKSFETCLKDLLNYIVKVTECGGYGCLKWILKIMNVILPSIKKHDINFDVIVFMNRMWKEIYELKSNNQYSVCMEEFINFITQDTLSETSMYNNHIISFCHKIIENGPVKNMPLYYLIQRLSTITIKEPFLFVLVDILLYSPVPRRDQRITENLINEIIDYSKSGMTSTDNDSHFNYEIQYLAITTLSNLDPEYYDLVTTFLMNKVDDTYGKKVRYHGNSQPHRTILTVLQHLLFIKLLKPSFEGSRSIVNWCTELLGKLPHQPSVRICLEWYIALYFFTQNVPLNENVINTLNSNRVPLTSQFAILYWVTKYRLSIGICSNSEYEFVMDQLLSHTMGQMFNIRLHAQYYAAKLHANSHTTKYSYIINVIQKTFEENSNDKNFIKLCQDYFANDFDIITDLTPAFIYYFVPKYTAVSTNEKMYLDFTLNTFGNINKILNNNSNCLQSKNRKPDNFVFDFEFPVSNDNKIAESCEPNSTIQKKYIPWKNMSDIDVCQIDRKEKSKSELIVVASLIDKLPNLGGMARTSEVFGVKTYVVDSLRHLQDKQFQGLSVSAENWVNIEEVRPGPSLKEYLQKMKEEGYVIVAAEQTSTSCQLQTFKFPKKTLLLLGHEKEGVPCNLLPLMDHCVEIPQQGVVRSLNVHVTAAIFVWEYSQQHLLT